MRSLLLLGGGLTLLLTIVAVASRGDRVSPARGDGASEGVRDYVLSTYLVVGALVFLAFMYLLVKERESLKTKRSRAGPVRQLLQFAIVMGALFLAGHYIWDALRGVRDAANQMAGQPPSKSGGTRTRSEAEPDAPGAQFRWAPVIALGALGVVSVAALATRRARRRGELDDHDVADALAAVLDDALADLRTDADPRRAVIAAYARMEKLLAAHRIPRRPSEAPFEYLGRVLLELDTSAEAVFELTALFERAKFSRHAIDEGMRDEAIEALVAVRDELRADS